MRFLLAIAFLLFLVSPLAAQDEKRSVKVPDAKTVNLAFDNLVFLPDPSPDGPGNIVRKWKTPISIMLADNRPDKHLYMLDSFIGAFSGVPNLFIRNEGVIPFSDLQKAPPELVKRANLHMMIGPKADLLFLLESMKAPASFLEDFRSDKSGCVPVGALGRELGFVAIFIREDLKEQEMGSCIGGMLTIALGLWPDSETPRIMFDGRGKALRLTPLGRTVMELLYHPRMTPGMTREEALLTADSILKSGGK
jgi:hypothetical protein